MYFRFYSYRLHSYSDRKHTIVLFIDLENESRFTDLIYLPSSNVHTLLASISKLFH